MSASTRATTQTASCTDIPKLTQTVYGFLDFTTTIGNTVMVFSPQSSPQFDPIIKPTIDQLNIIDSKPHFQEAEESKIGIKPTPLKVLNSNGQSTTNFTLETNNRFSLLSTPIKSLDFPEYALLSRQPDEFIEETYRLVNLNTRAEAERLRTDQSKRNNNYNSSAGLLARKKEISTRNVKSSLNENGLSTKISSKSTQGHQIITNIERRSKTRQPSSARVLKTVAPSLQNNKTPIESSGYTKSHRKNSRVPSEKRKLSRHKGKRRNKTIQVSGSQIAPSLTDTSARRSYRTKSNLATDENITVLSQNTLMLNRRPGRWQYKSSPKPKVNIRKSSTNNAKYEVQMDTLKVNNTILETNEDNQKIPKAFTLAKDLDAVGSQNTIVSDNDIIKPSNFIETLNVEISTPSNFDDTYYEIATIKSPYIFQAGLVKKTRFLTVTSTVEKSLKNDRIDEYSENDGPLTENILESTTQMIKPSFNGILTTLKPIHYTDSVETPELEIVTESFSFTQAKLKTEILPIVFDKQNETTQITLIQTYDYTSFVTVTQTVSPFRENFIPSKNFKDFEGILDEAGSEINLDLEFGDESNSGQFEVKSNSNKMIEIKGINSTSPISPFQLKDSEHFIKSEIPAISSPFNSIITTTRPIIKVDTVWESYVVPLIRGTESILRTLSKSVGVVEKTEYVTDVSTILLPMSQYPYSINPFYNPLLAIPQQQLITSTSIYETLITATSSKVLKLTFGARTAYTTLFSTSIVPTAVSKLVTATLPNQNSGSFQNYYSPPFPPFAYVG
ncbi:uncharacterized protein LOC115760485 isoform X2 [Drosophila novamexicana]|uniref:uncharacterized protein LOC115760485 isoform X2 n=1 Tax=Drosophila novamexicana TaxID=47314 RepID=UPI0011E5FBFF|nr:uncharacterized protein LOC115760485 isoform X2 [Drosophila novamexicana]